LRPLDKKVAEVSPNRSWVAVLGLCDILRNLCSFLIPNRFPIRNNKYIWQKIFIDLIFIYDIIVSNTHIWCLKGLYYNVLGLFLLHKVLVCGLSSFVALFREGRACFVRMFEKESVDVLRALGARNFCSNVRKFKVLQSLRV
jgi:hypothetical protein